MNIYVVGTNFVNKGAELMLHAIMQQTAQWPNPPGIAGDLRHGSFEQRDQVGMRHFIWRPLQGNFAPAVLMNAATSMMPKGMRESKHYVVESELDGVLDASGLLYSSQCKTISTVVRKDMFKRFAKRGKPVVLMPQSFGPFEEPVQRAAMIEMLNTATITYARDNTSLKYIQELTPNNDRIRLAPDFTNLCKVELPAKYEFVKDYVLIVPNVKMTTKTDASVSDAYIPFLQNVVSYLRKEGQQVALLVHSEDHDKDVADALNASLSEPLKTIVEPDALAIKALIGASRGLVASRFHAVVSALSQGKPCLVTGWSHKYKELLGDYGQSDWLMNPTKDVTPVNEALGQIFGVGNYDANRSALLVAAAKEKERAKEMWTTVRGLFGQSA